jgi:hypothetical protein
VPVFPASKRRGAKVAVIAFSLLAAIYLLSVLRSFDDAIVIDNAVGLPQDQVDEMLKHATNIESFPLSDIEYLRRKYQWRPWSRARLFMTITGNQDEVKVFAGFDEGPLSGGGKEFSARRVSGKWEFFEEYSWVG